MAAHLHYGNYCHCFVHTFLFLCRRVNSCRELLLWGGMISCICPCPGPAGGRGWSVLSITDGVIELLLLSLVCILNSFDLLCASTQQICTLIPSVCNLISINIPNRTMYLFSVCSVLTHLLLFYPSVTY